MPNRAEKIAKLNDKLRTTFNDAHGRIMMTNGIANLPKNDLFQVFKKVQEFNQFTEDNDPYGEHDLGSFDYKNQKVIWKIDYHDKDNLDHGSEDPADVDKTIRIMTIMLGREY